MNTHMRDPNWLKTEKTPPATQRLHLTEFPAKSLQPKRKLTGEVGIFETDQYGFITNWSQKAEQVYGYEQDEMLGKHIADLYTAGDLLHGKPLHELQAVESRGSYFSFSWQKRKNGQEFWTYSECQTIKNEQGRLLGYRKFVVETPTSISA